MDVQTSRLSGHGFTEGPDCRTNSRRRRRYDGILNVIITRAYTVCGSGRCTLGARDLTLSAAGVNGAVERGRERIPLSPPPPPRISRCSYATAAAAAATRSVSPRWVEVAHRRSPSRRSRKSQARVTIHRNTTSDRAFVSLSSAIRSSVRSRGLSFFFCFSNFSRCSHLFAWYFTYETETPIPSRRRRQFRITSAASSCDRSRLGTKGIGRSATVGRRRLHHRRRRRVSCPVSADADRQPFSFPDNRFNETTSESVRSSPFCRSMNFFRSFRDTHPLSSRGRPRT